MKIKNVGLLGGNFRNKLSHGPFNLIFCGIFCFKFNLIFGNACVPLLYQLLGRYHHGDPLQQSWAFFGGMPFHVCLFDGGVFVLYELFKKCRTTVS